MVYRGHKSEAIQGISIKTELELHFVVRKTMPKKEKYLKGKTHSRYQYQYTFCICISLNQNDQ
jgi:hypothetical protein